MLGAIKFSQIKATKNWFRVDATNRVVGRLASEIAHILQGKHKPTYTPNKEEGDCVVVTNCERIIFTGRKWDQKVYYWHTGWAGGLKQQKVMHTLERYPERILKEAVMGMLPKNRLREERIKKLKLFAGEEHEHEHELKKSVELPQINFEASKWKQIPLDPAVYKGVIAEWGTEDASLNVNVVENWGWKRYPTKRRIRWNHLERKAIRDYLSAKETVVWGDVDPTEDLLTLTDPANTPYYKQLSLEKKKETPKKLEKVVYYPRVKIEVLNAEDAEKQRQTADRLLAEDIKLELSKNPAPALAAKNAPKKK